MLLFHNDKIEYRTPDGQVLMGKVASVSGSRVYLQNGYATYMSYVIRQINE